MVLNAMLLAFGMLSFKPAFSLSFFTLIKKMKHYTQKLKTESFFFSKIRNKQGGPNIQYSTESTSQDNWTKLINQ